MGIKKWMYYLFTTLKCFESLSNYKNAIYAALRHNKLVLVIKTENIISHFKLKRAAAITGKFAILHFSKTQFTRGIMSLLFRKQRRP